MTFKFGKEIIPGYRTIGISNHCIMGAATGKRKDPYALFLINENSAISAMIRFDDGKAAAREMVLGTNTRAKTGR